MSIKEIRNNISIHFDINEEFISLSAFRYNLTKMLNYLFYKKI